MIFPVNYAGDLAKVMKKTILLSRIAKLAEGIEREYFARVDTKRMHRSRAKEAGMTEEKAAALVRKIIDDDDANRSLLSNEKRESETPFIIDPSEKDLLTGNLTQSQRDKISSLLGEWDEPEKTMGIDVS